MKKHTNLSHFEHLEMPTLRVLSFNMHKGKGWFNVKSQLPILRDEIRKIEPDIVLLQESKDNQFEFLAEEIWEHVRYGKNAIYPDGHHGNAILSKYPILFSENIDISMGKYERRSILHAKISLHNNKHLHLLCVHLGLFKKDRNRQLNYIVDHINEKIPKSHPLILGGDFNDLYSHATEPLIHRLGLEESFLNYHGSYARTFPAWAPMLRLDRIYCRGFKTVHAQCLTHKKWKGLSDHIAINVLLDLA